GNQLLEIDKEPILGVKEEFSFKPMVKHAEGSYYLICRYKQILYDIKGQTTLPFRVARASSQGEVYIIPGRLEFAYGITNEEMNI
ncbi:hypothetical protein ACFLWK_01495, partial [Chloroflexota bacterium]